MTLDTMDRRWRLLDQRFGPLRPRELVDDVAVLRVLSEKVGPPGHLEIAEVKAGRNRAADERVRVRPFQTGAKPVSPGYHTLQLFVCFGVLPQSDHAVIAVRIDTMNEQRCAGIEMPYLVASQAVQRGKISACQQKVNRRRSAARSPGSGEQSGFRNHYLRPVSLAEEPSFGMWLESQVSNPVLCVGHASAYGSAIDASQSSP